MNKRPVQKTLQECRRSIGDLEAGNSNLRAEINWLKEEMEALVGYLKLEFKYMPEIVTPRRCEAVPQKKQTP